DSHLGLIVGEDTGATLILVIIKTCLAGLVVVAVATLGLAARSGTVLAHDCNNPWHMSSSGSDSHHDGGHDTCPLLPPPPPRRPPDPPARPHRRGQAGLHAGSGPDGRCSAGPATGTDAQRPGGCPGSAGARASPARGRRHCTGRRVARRCKLGRLWRVRACA